MTTAEIEVTTILPVNNKHCRDNGKNLKSLVMTTYRRKFR